MLIAPRSWLRAALLPFLLPWLACGAADTEPAATSPGRTAEPVPSSNRLANAGFEAGRESWAIRDRSRHWGDFRVVEAPVHSGRQSVHLRLYHGPTLPRRRAKVYGVVQELQAPLPEVVSGWYRAERWEKTAAATDLYLQLVAIVWGDPRAPERVAPEDPQRDVPNYQLRYYLAGLEKVPFRLSNARFAFVERGGPALGSWQHFEVRLREDFERLWGGPPGDFERLDLLFEARWDNMPPGGAVYADVYYDDLYAGEAGPRASARRP